MTIESSWPGPRPASGGELAAEPGVGPPYVGNDEVRPRVGPAATTTNGAPPRRGGHVGIFVVVGEDVDPDDVVGY